MIVPHARVGRYEIEAHLASGGMAEVYRARDVESGAIVALKIPHDGEEIWEAERTGALLQVELSRIDPRVPRVLDLGDADDRFVAMEYVDGEDLSRRIQRGPLDWREATRIAIELCGVLGTARACAVGTNGDAAGIVHGDIKPRNVRVDPDGRVKVLDFGIAKALRVARVETRNLYGSVPYSSPERLDRAHVDFHSDLWSVAVVLYEMLAGVRPFRAASDHELESLIRNGLPAPAIEREIPLEFEAVLGKALAPRLADRYASAAELEEDLRAVLHGMTPAAHSERAVRRATGQPDHGDATRRTLPSANGVDHGDATHRTLLDGLADPDDDATRRTLDASSSMDGAFTTAGTPAMAAAFAPAAAAGLEAAVPVLPVTPVATSARARAPRFWRMPWRLLLVAVVVVIVAREIAGLSRAVDLRASLPTRPRGDANAVWAEYQRLSRRNLLVNLSGVGGGVREWLVGHADDLISRYRSDTPSIWESGWRNAQSLLERAASLDPGDRKIQSRLEYVRGQLLRIAGRDNPQRAQSMEQYDAAVASFERSARLWPTWADPHIGLAQVYAYGKKDPERVASELDQARERKFPFGERETALQADAYRLRAERRWTSPTDAFDADQRYRHLERTRDDIDQALALYETVPAYGDVARHLRTLRQRRTDIEIRMRELGGETPLLSQ